MSGDRAWTAPEMTPQVDGISDEPGDRSDRSDGIERQEPAPGDVPGPGGRVEGRSRLGTLDQPDATDEGDGTERNKPPA
jgi:hypothetical protein